jgi:predicted metal-binding membrane protein
MESRSRGLTATVLILAGAYQLTAWKNACLAQCRSPIGFLARHWRTGVSGTFRMGVSHGAYCVGCCWAVMCVLFAVGVMNLVWIAALSAFAMIEKLVPRGYHVARVTGLLFICAGIAVLGRI